MTDFLLEILSEEIPAKMQKNAAENFSNIACEILMKAGLAFTNNHVQTLISPRRISLYISNPLLLSKKSDQKLQLIKKPLKDFCALTV